MMIVRFRQVALVVATGLFGLGMAACDDDTGSAMPVVDLSVNADLTMKKTGDMAMPPDQGVPSNGQVTVADVVGNLPVPNADGGVTILPNTHILATQVSFPLTAGQSQHSDADPLHGCSWNRYDLVNGPAPGADENAGGVEIAGYDATNTRAVDISKPATFQAPFAPNAKIHCAYGSGALPTAYDCRFGDPVTGDLTSNYIFPMLPNGSGGFIEQHPLPDGTTVAEKTGTPTVMGSFSDALTANINLGTGATLVDKFYIISINGDATAHSLDQINGKFSAAAANDLTIVWSCDGTATPGAGCTTGTPGKADLLGLLVKTRPTSAGKFGTAVCIDEAGNSASHTVTLSKQVMTDILGSDANQVAQFLLVHLKAAPQVSGAHLVFLTAGRGGFAVVRQN